MKTIIDAVNELKGYLINSELIFLNGDKYVLYSTRRKAFIISSRKNYPKYAYDYICTVKAFNELVAELKSWQPTIEGVKND